MFFGVRQTWQRNYLLRTNIELLTAAYAFGICMLSVLFAYEGWSSPIIGYVSALFFGYYAAVYLKSGIYNFKYKNALWKTDSYLIDTSKPLGDSNRLWAGKGFRWTKDHSQRLYEIMAEDGAEKEFSRPPVAYNIARTIEKIAVKSKLTPIALAVSENHFLNPYPNLPVDDDDDRNPGGLPYIHAVEPNEVDVSIPYNALNSHTLCLGTTRVGKTRSAEVMITQDIRNHLDSTVIIIDPKGDQELAMRAYMEAKRAGKAEKFYFFSLAFPHLSCKYNGLAEFNRITEVATRLTAPLSEAGNSKTFKDFAWLFINTCQKGVYKMGKIATYENIQGYLSDPQSLVFDYIKHLEDEELDEFIESTVEAIDVNKLPPADRGKSPRVLAIKAMLQDPPEHIIERIQDDEVLRNITKILEYDKSYYDKITASAMPHLSKLTTGSVSELISPNYDDVRDDRRVLSLRKAIREGAVIYIGLDAQTDKTVASATGNGFLAEILSISGEIYNHGTEKGIVSLPGEKPKAKAKVRLHVDEANEVFGDEFNPILNKAGGSGVMVTAYTQSISDIEVRLGDKSKANQALGNFGTIFVFRVRGEDTAKYFVDQMPEVKVMSVDAPASNVMDGMGGNADGRFKTSGADTISYETKPLIPLTAFLELPKGQAFLYSGSKWYKIKLPLFETEPDMPDNVVAMLSDQEQELGYRITKDIPRAA